MSQLSSQQGDLPADGGSSVTEGNTLSGRVKILERLFSRQRKVKFQRNLAVSMATGILFYHNMFSYQARESSLVLAGFLTAQFLQKTVFMKPLL